MRNTKIVYSFDLKRLVKPNRTEMQRANSVTGSLEGFINASKVGNIKNINKYKLRNALVLTICSRLRHRFKESYVLFGPSEIPILKDKIDTLEKTVLESTEGLDRGTVIEFKSCIRVLTQGYTDIKRHNDNGHFDIDSEYYQ